MLDRAYFSDDLGGLIEFAGLEALDIHLDRTTRLYALDGSREGLAFRPGVEDDLYRDAGLGNLAAVVYEYGEDELIRAGEDHVPVRIKGPPSHLDAQQLHLMQGVWI